MLRAVSTFIARDAFAATTPWSCHDTDDKILRLHCSARSILFVTTTSTKMMTTTKTMVMTRRRMHQVTGRDAACGIHFHCVMVCAVRSGPPTTLTRFCACTARRGAFFRDDDVDEDDDKVSILYLLPSGSLNVASPVRVYDHLLAGDLCSMILPSAARLEFHRQIFGNDATDVTDCTRAR